jgi:Holin of 3TMs, for gene-transfer release
MTLPVLLQAGLPALIKGLADGLKKVDTPVAQGASGALDTLMEAFGKGEISPEQLTEINRHVERMQELESSERKDSITQINESLRTEVASSDPYVRRMRPTFGYIIALTWAAQMFSIAYVIVFETNQAALVIEAVQSLGTIWAVGLSVLGIYVYKRSEEKKGEPSPSPFSPAAPSSPIRKPYNS